MKTPVLSPHARQRCKEMGIGTKVAKRIVQKPTTTYPSPPSYPGNRKVVSSREYPDYLVVYDLDDNQVVTVLLKTEEWMTREEANRQARERVAF